jgi:hypothetical protein
VLASAHNQTLQYWTSWGNQTTGDCTNLVHIIGPVRYSCCCNLITEETHENLRAASPAHSCRLLPVFIFKTGSGEQKKHFSCRLWNGWQFAAHFP